MKYKEKKADGPDIFFLHMATQNVTKLPMVARNRANQLRKIFLKLTFFN
tara:strand:+ start:16992 stop:17138 length:147 start_codon:yes stop_codon:yes gene_type:complete